MEGALYELAGESHRVGGVVFAFHLFNRSEQNDVVVSSEFKVGVTVSVTL